MLAQVLLQASAGGGGQMWGNIILFGGIIVIFYLFMIRPQQKKQKDQKKFIEAIKKGDKIVTVGGIHGKIASIEDDTVMLEIERGAKMRIEKSSISLEASNKQSDKK